MADATNSPVPATYGTCPACDTFCRQVGPQWMPILADERDELIAHFTCSRCNSTRIPMAKTAWGEFGTLLIVDTTVFAEAA